MPAHNYTFIRGIVMRDPFFNRVRTSDNGTGTGTRMPFLRFYLRVPRDPSQPEPSQRTPSVLSRTATSPTTSIQRLRQGCRLACPAGCSSES